MTALILAILLAYLLGSIPTSYILARSIKGIDIRKYGSGNVGATNLLRTLGKGSAIIALFVDILKGVAAVMLLSGLLYPYGVKIDYESFRILLGLAAICGHIWTVFLNFKGGKGVATSIGVLMVLCPNVLCIVAVVWFIVILFSKYVSLASILAFISLPIATTIMGESFKMVIFAITLCIISCYKHKSNIVRLINGEESKIGEKIRV